MVTNSEVTKVRNVLKKAKQVLLDNKWTKGALAKKANGHTVCEPNDSQATCFCAMGAVCSVLNVDGLSEPTTLEQRVYDVLVFAVNSVSECYDVPEFNDSPATTKQDVLDIFDYAISNTKSLLS